MELLLFVFAFGIYWFGYCRGYDNRKCGKRMTREEIDKVVKEIREYCINNNCKSCEAYSIHGCVFTNGSPDEWFTIEEADKAESEKALEREEGYLTDYLPTEDFNEMDDIISTLNRRQSRR